ncbi:MAG: hypothetical protein OXC57_14490 [Rhodobacteraceae bacterium]|nr:hypothetical protein [Paracoccaceae bacterium]
MVPCLTNDSHTFIANEIYTCGIGKNALISPLDKKVRLNLADAESIRRKVLDCYLEDGDTTLGYKVGFTSKTVQEQHGISEPEFGFLTDRMKLTNKSQIPVQGTAPVLVEPEICFKLADGFEGTEISVQDVLDKTERIYLSLELVESRVGLASGINNVIMDNVGASRILISEPGFSPGDFDLEDTMVNLTVDDLHFTGKTSDVLENPANSIIWLNKRLGKLGSLGGQLNKGDFVMTGSPIKPIPLVKGSMITAEWCNIGTIEVEMV